MIYTGYEEITMSDEQMAQFYSGELNLGLLENQYAILKNSDNKIIDKYCLQGKKLRRVSYPIIENYFCGLIKPRNTYQELAIDLLQNRDSKVKVVRGVYGSGKDYLMLNEALSLIDKGIFEKIIYIRPNVTVAGVPDIGYLKGDAFEKLSWTLAPLYDKVGGEEGVTRLIEEGKLEMVPLPFIRGRSFENSIIYVCEGQNTTTEIAKLVISRIGEGSELWINSDSHQTDKRLYDEDNGITKMVDRLKGNELFGTVYLPITERSKVAELSSLLDD